MPLSDDKAAWLAGMGLTASRGKRRRSSSAAEPNQSTEPEASFETPEDDSQSSMPVGYQPAYPVSGGDNPPPVPHKPPPPPKPKPRPTPPPPPPPPAPAEEPNMTPMPPEERPPGPWADGDTEGPLYTPSPAPDHSGGEEAEPGALGHNATGVTEQFDFPIDFPKVHAWGGKIEIEFKVTVQATASFLPQEGNQVQLTYNAKEGMLIKAAKAWSLENAMKDLGAPGWLEKSKFGFEAEASGTGLTIKAGYAVEFGKRGSVEVSGVLAKIEAGKAPTLGAVEIAYITPKLALADWVEENVQVAQVSLSVKGAATIAPRWAHVIAEEAAKEAAIAIAEAGAEAGVEVGAEAAGGAIGIDTVLSIGLGGVAIGTGIGVARMFQHRATSKELRKLIGDAVRDLRGGLYQGASGADAAGGSDLFMQGHHFGLMAYREAGKIVLANVQPTPQPEEAAALARKLASDAVGKWSAFARIENDIRWAVFRSWADNNHGLWTNEEDAQVAVYECFGVSKEPPNGPHMSYWVKLKEA